MQDAPRRVLHIFASAGDTEGRGEFPVKMTREEYNRYVMARARPSPIGKDCLWAFCVGGAICAFGQLLSGLYRRWGASEEDAGVWVAMTLIVLAALLTGLGVFDDGARWAGAGTLVPITGFANAMTSPALEFKSEGFITGTAVKLFTIAGPVIAYGVSASVVYGIIYWIATLL